MKTQPPTADSHVEVEMDEHEQLSVPKGSTNNIRMHSITTISWFFILIASAKEDVKLHQIKMLILKCCNGQA